MTIAIAPPISFALRSAIFCSAICRTLILRHFAHGLVSWSAAPFAAPAAFFSKKLVGGVFVTNVKLRSAKR